MVADHWVDCSKTPVWPACNNTTSADGESDRANGEWVGGYPSGEAHTGSPFEISGK